MRTYSFQANAIITFDIVADSEEAAREQVAKMREWLAYSKEPHELTLHLQAPYINIDPDTLYLGDVWDDDDDSCDFGGYEAVTE